MADQEQGESPLHNEAEGLGTADSITPPPAMRPAASGARDFLSVSADLKGKLKAIAEETLATLAAMLSVGLMRLAGDLLLGKEAKFFDRVPVHWVTDAGEVAMFLKLLWQFISS